jgi:hypothetical protein
MGKTKETANLVSNGLLTPNISDIGIGIGTTNPTAALDVLGDVNITGVITATTFVGNISGGVTGDATGLTGSPSITVTDITASGNVSIAGTLTYQDVTNIDSIGLVTARSGIHVTGGNVGIGTDSNLTANITIGNIQETSTTNKGALAIKTLSNSDSNIGESAIFIEESGSNYGFYHKASTYFSTTHYQLLESGSGNTLFTISDTGDVGIKTNYADTFALKILSEDENVIKIENSNNGVFGSDIRIFQDSNSPAANDKLLTLDVRGNDSGGNEITYVEAIASIEDPTNGSEDGKFTIQTRTAGTLTDRIVVDSGGVGIGTDNPGSILEVHSDTIPRINSVWQKSKHIGMSVGGSGGGFVITDGHFMTINHQPYSDRGTDNNLTERIRITSNGDVGIGQDNPQSKLQIENAGEQLRLTYPSIASYIHEVKSNGDYAIDKDGTERLRISSDGELLIGGHTSGPSNQTPKIEAREDGTSNIWRALINSSNDTADKSAFLGIHGTKPGVFAHDRDMTAWDTLYLNTIDPLTTTNGGDVYTGGKFAIGTNNPNGYTFVCEKRDASGTTGTKNLVAKFVNAGQNTIEINMYGGSSDQVQFAATNQEQRISFCTGTNTSNVNQDTHTLYLTENRDIWGRGLGSSSYGGALFIGSGANPLSTLCALRDTNRRPMLYLGGNYPEITLAHEQASNSRHGPTLKFCTYVQSTNTATGNQFVIGTNGTGTQLDIGHAIAAQNGNAHNGIDSYNGTSRVRVDATAGAVKIPGHVIQVGYARHDPNSDSYTTVGQDTKALSAVYLDFTPKYANSQLLIITRMHTRMINANGCSYGIDVSGDSGLSWNALDGMVQRNAMDFFYKGDQVNHHYTGFCLTYISATNTNSRRYSPWGQGWGGGTWEISYGHGEHSVTVLEIAGTI